MYLAECMSGMRTRITAITRTKIEFQGIGDQCRYLCNNMNGWETSNNQKLIVNNIAYVKDDWTNVTSTILKKINSNLLNTRYHPLCILKKYIWNYFHNLGFKLCDNKDFSPIVNVCQNFDQLLISNNHPSRKKSDNYYLNQTYMLRAHTTAHDNYLITKGVDKFVIFGDVYRRDEIDRSHYPVFHQVDGKDGTSTQQSKLIHSLRSTLESLMKTIFKEDDIEMRWVDCTFPFTKPSFELEIRSKIRDINWTEILGCGLLHQDILTNCGMGHKMGWAFGIGLERLAMFKFHIDDIRLFWCDDPRFYNQFKSESIDIKFKLFSQHDASFRDISFWINPGEFIDHNDLYEFFRENSGNLVEQVELIDQFIHPNTNIHSRCYRVTYRSIHKKLSHDEVNVIHNSIVKDITHKFNIQIR